MTYAAEWSAIAGRITANWSATSSVSWPGAAFTPPTDGSSWIRVTTQAADAYQAEIGVTGSRSFRHTGLLLCQVFVSEETRPQGGAKEAALALADTFAALFRGVTVGSIRFHAPRVNDIGPDGHGWYQVNVLTDFDRDSLF